MKRHFLTLSILLVVTQLFGQESRFWVNGNGKWTDQSHWATVSGGQAGASVPDKAADVVFDQYSFNGGKNTVTVGADAFVGSLSSENAEFTLSGKASLTIGGSVNVDDKLNFDKFRGALVLAAEGDQTLNIPTELISDIIIESGNWTLAANLTTEGNIFLKSGSLTTAGFEVNCAEFNGNDAEASLNIENSTIICDKWNFGSASNLTFDAAGSTIMVKGNFLTNFLTVSNLKYNIVRSYSAEKAMPMVVYADVTNVTCPSNATEANNAEKAKKKDGKIKVTIGDGSGTYNIIVIKTGVLVNKLVAQVENVNNYTFENLEANTYTVGYYLGEFNDETLLTSSTQAIVEAPEDYVGSIEVTKDADCYGGPIKELSAIVTGGTSDYSYEWKKTGTSGTYSTDPYVTDIVSGSRLAVSIKDAAGCRYEGENGSFGFNYVVGSSRNSYTTGPTQVIATVSSDPSCEGEETGRITINAQGGTGVFQLYTATASSGTPVYSSTTTNVLNNVKSGAYNIVVTDTKGCVSEEIPVQVAEIPAPTADAGGDASSCKESSFKLSGKATNYSSIEWSTSGSGSFDDNTSATPTYTPSSADESAGSVVLTMTVYGNGTCSPVYDAMTLTFINKPMPSIVTTEHDVCGLSETLEATASMSGSLIWEKASGAGNATFDGSNVTVDKAGVYTFKVKEIEPSDAKCEGYSAGTVSLTFYEAPTVNITTADGSVCGVESMTVEATVANQTSMLWTSDGDGTFSSTDAATTTYTPAASDAGKNITLTLTVSNGVCPDATDTYVLTVNKVPAPINTTVGGDICGFSTNATATASLPGSTLAWMCNESGLTFDSPSAASTNVTAANEGTYNIYVVESLNGCDAQSASVAVSFYKPSTIAITSGSTATICADGEYDLTSEADNCTGYTWSVTGGTGSFAPSSTAQNPTFTPDAPGVYTIKVVGTANALGICDNPEATMTLTVNALPTPSIVTLPTEVCGTTTSAVAQKSDASNTLTWKCDDARVSFSNSTSESTEITATASSEGITYNIYVVETTAGGCVGETTPVAVTFYSEPDIKINEDDATICDDGVSTFTYSAAIENCTTVVWSVTGGTGTFTPATGTSTVFKPTSGSGSYTIVATGTPNAAVCAAPSDSKTLNVSSLPNPTITSIDGNSICGTGTTLTGTASQGGTLAWSVESTPAGGTASVSSTGVVSGVTVQGTYTFKLVETNQYGCEGFATIDIDFTFDPTITMATTADAICASETSYQVDGVSAENYASLQWTSSTGGTFSDASALNPVYNISAADVAAGSVELTLKAMPVSPCADPVTSTITLTINPLPVPTIDGDAVICMNGNATYTTESGMSDYVWTIVGGTGTSTTNSIEVTWTTAGVGSVSVTYTNGNGCTAAVPTEYAVTVNELPTIGLPSTLTSCTNSSITVNANVSGGLNPYVHSWTGDDVAYLDAVDVENPTFACTIAGTYNLNYMVVDNNGCQNTASVEITNLQGPSVNAGEDATLCYGTDYVNEDATYSDAYGVSWSTDGDGYFDNENDLNATYTPGANDWANGTVTLTLTAYSLSCGSVSDEVVLTLLPEMVVAIGSENPFDIAASTKIEVEIQGEHEAGYDLAFYLVAPDGTEVKLYNHEEDISADGKFAADGGDIASLKFATYATDMLDFSKMNAPISGAYKITDPNGWTNLYGKNPAEGGWSVKVVDAWPAYEGRLTRASISFTDINRQGLMQTILFDSKTMDEPIKDNASTSFYVPMGLRTSCYGVCDARAIVNVIGGSGEYNSFVWSDPSIVGTDTVDLCAGDFTVTVTDVNGCVATGGITVLSPDPILLNTTGSDVKCFGGNDGSASVVATQGVGTYSYEWNEDPSLNTSDIDDLTAGTYVVKVTDENLCWSMDTVEISQPASALNIDNIDITPSSCIEANGSISFSLSGGVAPYYVTCPTASFVDETATGLAADEYAVHIEDANGCSIDTVVSTKPAEIILTIAKEDVLCNGGNNGSLSVVAEGGQGDYTYSWLSGSDVISTEASVENLVAGTYTLQVVDAGGCQVDSTLVIEEPLKLEVTDNVTKASCGSADGSIELTVSGGVEPYSYLWSNGETTATVSGLTEGVYTVIVTDANLCEAYDTVTVNNDSELAITIDGVADVTNGCEFDGAINITVSGAHGTPSFSWTNEAGEEVSTAEDPTQLPKGTYFVKVVDEHTCAINESAIVGGVDKFEVTNMIVEDAKCNGSADGTLEPDVTSCGGVAPFTYLWAHDGSTAAKATGLAAGTYSVTVYDANGCESTISGTVGEPTPIIADFIMTPSGCSVNTGVFEAVNIKGGNAPYDVVWLESVSSTLVFSGNPFNTAGVGNYKAVIVDVNGCYSDTTTVTMVDESNLSVTGTVNNLECYNDNSGSIELTVSGGSGNYAYAWSNGATESTATNLSAGDYFITVTDLTSNCQTAQTFTVGQPEAIVPTIVFTKPVQCAGDTEASFYAKAEGGAGNYTYSWDNNGTIISSDSLVSGVGEGIYSVVIADANGCSVFDTVTIVYPDTLKIVASDMGESDCSGATGWAEVTVEGGIAPYAYFWHSAFNNDTVGTSARADNLGVDIYVVEVTDALGCNIVDTVEVFDKGTLEFPINNIIGVTCATICDGSATIGLVYDDNDVYNDDTKLKFMWNNNPNDTLRTSNSLCLGTNRVLVVNPDGCRKLKTFTITDELALRVVNVANYPDLNGDPNCNGSLTVTVAGGVGNYSYTWTDADNNKLDADSSTYETSVYSLCEGLYNLHIEDQNLNGCSVDTTIKIEHRPLTYDVVRNEATTCYGGDNGVLEVVGVGGYYEGYNYEWRSAQWPADSVATTALITNLKSGWYKFTISQRQKMVAITDSVFVNQPTDRLSAQYAIDGSHCYDAIGVIRILKTEGGNAPFTYSFSNESWATDSVKVTDNRTDVTKLAVGDYGMHIVDNKGCQFDTIVEVEDLSKFTVNLQYTEPRCYGEASGSVVAVASSLNGKNFKYEWTGKPEAKESTIYELTAGTYQVKVTDDSACVKFAAMELSQPAVVTLSVSNTIANSCYNSNDGEIQLSVKGGAGHFNQYSFIDANDASKFYTDDTETDSTLSLKGILPTGDYKALAYDKKGCASDTVNLRMFSRTPVIVMNGIKDLELPDCKELKADGTFAMNGRISVNASPMTTSQVSSTITGLGQVSSTTVDLATLFFKLDDGKVQEGKIFENLSARTYTITVGFGEELACPETTTHELGSKNDFAITSSYFYINDETVKKSVYTCPDNELTAYVTASAPFDYKFYANYVEEEDLIDPEERTKADTTRTDSAVAYVTRFRNVRYFADSLPVDSTIIDTVPVVVPVEVPRYKLDTVGNVVYAVFAEGSGAKGEKAWVDDILPYGVETYYYFKATDGMCMDLDSIKATSMKPTYKLRAKAYMDDATSDDLLVNGVYEVAEGARIVLDANDLKFDFTENIYSEQNWLWTSAPTDGNIGSGIKPETTLEDNPIAVQSYGNTMIKVRDSVNFEIYKTNESLTCYYSDSIKVNSISGIKPPQVFTPNGDGAHDTWHIEGLSSYDKVTIYVFNRWGGRVWQYSGGGREYTANEWNGTNEKNKPVPSGTYYYVIQCSDDVLGGKKITGPVTILR